MILWSFLKVKEFLGGFTGEKKAVAKPAKTKAVKAKATGEKVKKPAAPKKSKKKSEEKFMKTSEDGLGLGTRVKKQGGERTSHLSQIF